MYRSVLINLLEVIVLISDIVSCKLVPYVIGGDYTDIRKYPHSVLLILHCTDPYLCGGSVLTERAVLTAAHCLYPCKTVNNFAILLKYGHEITDSMRAIMVTKFLIHNNYDDSNLQNDIGMVYTHTPMELGLVKRVAVMNKFPRQPKYAYVAGWGVMNWKGETATNLKHVKQEFPPINECKMRGISAPGVFCGGGLHVKEHPDQGDSGSALVIFDYIQIGIVSFKYPNYGLIGYTNTTYYYKWILRASTNLYCSF